MKGHARNHEVIAAQHLRHFVDYISIEAADRGSDDYYRGDANDDSNQCEKSPQFVGKYLLQGNFQGVGIKGKEGFHYCYSCELSSVTWLYDRFLRKVCLSFRGVGQPVALGCPGYLSNVREPRSLTLR